MTNREAIEELKELIEIDLHPCPPIYEEALNLAIKALEERPQGKWIGGEIGHCSICGSEGCASDIWNGCKDGMYCPNCGADMRGDRE